MPRQIRITKTKKLDEILCVLEKMFPALSENEIVKLTISDFYAKNALDENGFTPDEVKSLQTVIDEADRGEIEGPFESVEEFIADLRK